MLTSCQSLFEAKSKQTRKIEEKTSPKTTNNYSNKKTQQKRHTKKTKNKKQQQQNTLFIRTRQHNIKKIYNFIFSKYKTKLTKTTETNKKHHACMYVCICASCLPLSENVHISMCLCIYLYLFVYVCVCVLSCIDAYINHRKPHISGFSRASSHNLCLSKNLHSVRRYHK